MSNLNPIKLTQYTSGGGCGCKIAPSVLEEILSTCKKQLPSKNIIIGNTNNDDAAVYDLENGQAIISTTDFFMPIVNNPYDFGRIAAANAISDVYAMGGRPIMALAILGWPLEKLSTEIAQQVLEGAHAVCKEVGIVIAGGHSINSAEPIFGLSVNGLVAIEHIKQNNGAQIGDYLFITKALGVGVLATALKKDLLNEDDEQLLVQQLSTINSLGEILGSKSFVTSMTDITGFGLLGHVIEMAKGSSLSVELFYNKIPILKNVKEFIKNRIVPDGTYRNWNSYSSQVEFENGVDVMEAFNILPDPQTNGGLLFSVSENEIDKIITLLKENNLDEFINPIGRFVEQFDKTIRVLN